ALSAVRSVLDDENGCADGISTAKHYVNGISALSDAYAQIGERLESLGVEIKDISETVTDLTDELNFDSREAEEIDERLSLIKSLKKKYGATVEDMLEY
ncbi:MAG: DNA repair protein RecN, partial [Clostridia bacterium]|nr:DNA repair protein RecN [Clostridia bacterium]